MVFKIRFQRKKKNALLKRNSLFIFSSLKSITKDNQNFYRKVKFPFKDTLKTYFWQRNTLFYTTTLSRLFYLI